MGQGGAGLPDPDQKRLGQLLIDTSDQGLESQSFEALTLDSFLRSNTGEPLAGLKGLGECLLSGKVDISYHKQLETLAQRLEQERVGIARQLWGRELYTKVPKKHRESVTLKSAMFRIVPISIGDAP